MFVAGLMIRRAVIDPVAVRLDDIVRDGPRAMIAQAANHAALQLQFEQIEIGMGMLPPKTVFQKLLSHAANGHATEGECLKLKADF